MNFIQLLEKTRNPGWNNNGESEIFEWCSLRSGRKVSLPFSVSGQSSLQELDRLSKEVNLTLGDLESAKAFVLAIANAGFSLQVMNAVLDDGASQADLRDFAFRQSSLFELVEDKAEVSALIAWILESFSELAQKNVRKLPFDSFQPHSRALLSYSHQVLKSVARLLLTLEVQEPFQLREEHFKNISMTITAVIEVNRSFIPPCKGNEAGVNIISQFLGIE